MQRDIRRLRSHRFDLLIIGGGIYGAIAACDAAERGLDVAIVEANDFGSGTTFNHLRTIHGGLRYLQTLDLARARESVRERRTLGRIAPAAVAPMPFVLPLSRSLSRGPLALRAAFLLDAVLSSDRNDGVPPSHALPRGRVLGRAAAEREFPGIEGIGDAGAAVWYDYVTTAPERLLWAWLQQAYAHGAVAANYVEALQLTVKRAAAAGAVVRDTRTDERFEISARAVVNATGAAIDGLLTPLRIPTGLLLLKAMNLVTSRPAPPFALGGTTRAGKTLFMVPWHGRALFGTWESTTAYPAGALDVVPAEVTAFMNDVNQAFPGLSLTLPEITLVHRGIVPAVRRPDGSVALDGQERLYDHALDGVARLVSVAGTKYTTARAVAERTVDIVCAQLGAAAAPCVTGERPLPVVVSEDDEALVRACRHEMVETLEDALMRRTAIGALGHPGRDVLEHAASVAANELGWSETRRQEEIAAIEARYGMLKP